MRGSGTVAPRTVLAPGAGHVAPSASKNPPRPHHPKRGFSCPGIPFVFTSSCAGGLQLLPRNECRLHDQWLVDLGACSLLSSWSLPWRFRLDLKPLFFFFKIYLFIHDRHREAETQEEGEAGFMPGARRGTRSRDSRIAPWAKGRR